MKKLFLLFIIFLSVNQLIAQNWNCVRPSVKTYYGFPTTNGKFGFSKMWVANTISYPQKEEYYFCKTFISEIDFRTFDFFYQCLDTNQAGSFGKKYVHTIYGIDTFFNYVNNPIIINTQATINDSWTLYANLGDTTIQATVVSVDTMTINNTLDSIKTISIQAYKGVNSINVINNNQMTLSKNNGIVTPFKWYFFPNFYSQWSNSILQVSILDSNTYIYKPRQNDYTKYQIGNDWIRYSLNCESWYWLANSCDSTYGPYYFVTQYDSVVNVVTLPSNKLAVEISRQNFQNQTPYIVYDTFYNVNATINSIVENDTTPCHLEVVASVSGSLKYPSTIEFIPSNCSTNIGIETQTKDLILFEIQNSNPTSNSDSCYQVGFPEFPSSIFINYLEGVGVINSKDYASSEYSYSENSYGYSYYNINSCTSGSKIGALSLPADAFTLSGYLNLNQNVHLNWITKNEHSVSTFTVERSLDNKNYYSIGTQLSKGDNLYENQYDFIDDISRVSAERVYYRIRMKDIDGKTKSSNTISIQNVQNNQEYLVYPNPSKGKINISYTNPNAETMHFVLSDITGRIVKQFSLNTSTSKTIIDVSDLPSGVYFYSFISDESEKVSGRISIEK